MSAAKLNLYIEQGVTFRRLLTIKDGDGVPIDLTGRSFRGQIRKTVGASRNLASFTFTLANQSTNPGEVEMLLSPDASVAIPTEKQTDPERKIEFFAFDVEMVLSGGEVTRLLEGLVQLSPEVTK